MNPGVNGQTPAYIQKPVCDQTLCFNTYWAAPLSSAAGKTKLRPSLKSLLVSLITFLLELKSMSCANERED